MQSEKTEQNILNGDVPPVENNFKHIPVEEFLGGEHAITKGTIENFESYLLYCLWLSISATTENPEQNRKLLLDLWLRKRKKDIDRDVATDMEARKKAQPDPSIEFIVLPDPEDCRNTLRARAEKFYADMLAFTCRSHNDDKT